MNLTRSRRSIALLVSLGLLFAAACSGGEDDAPTAATGTTGETSVGAALPDGSSGGPLSAPGVAIDAASPGDTLIRAAAQATEAQSYRYAIEFGLSGIPEMPGVSLNFSAEGEADAENERMRFSMDLSPLLSTFNYMGLSAEEQSEMDTLFGDGTFEMIVASDSAYLRWPMITSMLGVTTPWVSVDESLLGEEFTPASAAGSFGYDAGMALAFVEGLEDVEEVGVETVDGVEATHYRGVVGWESLLAQLPPEERAMAEAEMQAPDAPPFPRLPVDVWVDADNLVRRYSMTIDLAQMAADMGEPAGDAGGVFTVVYDLYDFGQSVVIDLPADAEVTPMTEELLNGEALATY